MILVTGAAGKTGLAVVRALAQGGTPVRAWGHRREQESLVRRAGAMEWLCGELLDRQLAARAMTGVSAVYHICPNVSADEVAIGESMLAAAEQQGVARFVYHSVLWPQIESMPHHWRKLRVEELLLSLLSSALKSTLDWTVLQPTAYMQNLQAHWPQMAETGVLPVPYSTRSRIQLVDLEDVAAVAAKVLTEPGHNHAVYPLCSADCPSQDEVASLASEVLGRPVAAQQIALDVWRRQAEASGLDDERIETLAAMFRYYDQFGLHGNANVLRWLLGREPHRLHEVMLRLGSGLAGGSC